MAACRIEVRLLVPVRLHLRYGRLEGDFTSGNYRLSMRWATMFVEVQYSELFLTVLQQSHSSDTRLLSRGGCSYIEPFRTGRSGEDVLQVLVLPWQMRKPQVFPSELPS